MFGFSPRRVVVPRPAGGSQRWQRSGQALARRAVRVRELIRETADAVTLVLETEDGRPLAFRAGQYLTHCFEIGGAPVKRAYSLSAPEGGALACTIKCVRGGQVSDYVTRVLKPGDRYFILGPSGDLTLDEKDEGPLVFLAGGSGITPVMGLIETALARKPDRFVKLVYASRSPEETIFAARLDALRAKHRSLEIEFVHSAAQGRLDAAGAARRLHRDYASYYLCGPEGLMAAAGHGLRALGVPAEKIRRERFLAAAQPAAQRPTAPQEIVFRRFHRVVTQQPGETMLDAALREGLPLPFSCTVGGCASCKLRVAEGRVALNEPNCLSSEEKAAGFTLACSAYALERVVVEG